MTGLRIKCVCRGIIPVVNLYTTIKLTIQRRRDAVGDTTAGTEELTPS